MKDQGIMTTQVDTTSFWIKFFADAGIPAGGYSICTSALTPDGGLINGVGAMSQGKALPIWAKIFSHQLERKSWSFSHFTFWHTLFESVTSNFVTGT